MRMARSKVPIIHEQNTKFELGGAITLRDGSDCTIAACGITVSMALEAAESLASEGISCRVIDVYSIKPINKKLLEKAARETGSIVTCEEHNGLCSYNRFGSANYPTNLGIAHHRYVIPHKTIRAIAKVRHLANFALCS